MIMYVDGYVLPIPIENLKNYASMAKKAGKIWREHGALEYRECVGDDLAIPGVTPFAKGLKLKEGETVIFAWIVYKSRADRDRVNAKVMADPRMNKICDPKNMPFNVKRMVCGGFKVLIDL